MIRQAANSSLPSVWSLLMSASSGLRLLYWTPVPCSCGSAHLYHLRWAFQLSQLCLGDPAYKAANLNPLFTVAVMTDVKWGCVISKVVLMLNQNSLASYLFYFTLQSLYSALKSHCSKNKKQKKKPDTMSLVALLSFYWLKRRGEKKSEYWTSSGGERLILLFTL